MPKHLIQAVFQKTSDYTITTGDDIILVDASSGDVTITLPACSSTANYNFTIKRTDTSANSVIIDGNGSDTIDGELTQTLDAYDAIKITTNGTSWHII